MSAVIEVLITHDICLITPKQISDFMLAVLNELSSDELEKKEVELSILITDDIEIQELNKNYRDKDKPTDVLSFSQVEGESLLLGANLPLGDIVISYDTALRQAESLAVSIEQEIARLLVHGLLHLIGYDHENVSEDEAKLMFSREDELLRLTSKIAIFK